MKCKSCGEANPADATNCQKCGTPLTISKQEYVLGTRMSTQDQPELPAWLESLRAGERPAAPPASPSSFSAADLVDGGSLPNWMRPERTDVSDPGLSGPQHAIRSSAYSAPNTDGGFTSPQNISAGSLIDEQSLPPWMQPEKPQENISAASLIQPDDMPDWMKAMQPQAQPQRPASQPQTQPFQQAQNRSANFPAPSAPVPAVSPQNMQGQRPLPPQGFSARDLIDDQVLPDWMMQPQGQNSAGPSTAGMPGQASLAASSLIDKDALPNWMQQNAQGPSSPSLARPQQSAQQPAQPFNNAVWQGSAQNLPPGGGQNAFPQSGTPGPGETLSASSFIDPNVLPEWLRNVGEQGAGRQGASQGRPGAYGVPPRVENVRVPNRPRAEMGPVEGSEEAANVFASMLGVAANAPKFPTNSGQVPQMPPAPYGQPGRSVPNPSQNTPGQAPNTARGYTGPQPTPGGYIGMDGQPQAYPSTNSQPTPGYPGTSGQSQQPWGYSGTGPQPTPGYTNIGNQPQQPQGYPGTGPQPTPGYPGTGGQSQQPWGYSGTGPQPTPGYTSIGSQPQQPQGYPGTGPQYSPGGYNSGNAGNMNAGNLGVGQGNYGAPMPPARNPQGPPPMYTGQGGFDDQGMQEKPAKRGLFEAIRSLFFR